MKASRTTWRRVRVAVLAFLARCLYGLVRRTARPVVFADADEILRAFAAGERVIVAFWHAQLGMVQLAYRGPGICIQVSRHTDGEIIARAVRPFGIRAARGSATRGAIGSLREMLRAFAEGLDLAVAADGPRGPRHVAKSGAIQLAAATGARLFPVAAAPGWRWIARRSWDRFVVPMPFTRVFYAVGEPMRVSKGDSAEEMEAARGRLESELNRLTRHAESRCGARP